MRHPPLTPVVLALLLLVATGARCRTAIAQAPATPAAAEAAPAPTGPLAEILIRAGLEGLPEPPTAVRLLRLSLPPGASVPLHTLTGPEFVYVESGVVAVRVEGEAVVAPSNDSVAPLAAAVAPVGEAFALAPGDQLALPTNVPVAFENGGPEPASLLTLLFVPADDAAPELRWVDATPSAQTLAGTNSRLLADAVATEWPAGPLTVAVDRLALGPGERIPGAAGPVLLAVEAGRFSFALLQGEFRVGRAGGPSDAAATPGASYELGPGDSVYFPTSLSDVPRPGDRGLLVLLRLSVVPAADVEAADGAAASPPSDPDPSSRLAGSEAPSTPDFPEGTSVLVGRAGVILLAAPATDAEVVAELSAGSELVVSGPPRDGDGSVWYPVTAVDDPSITGYIGEELLAPLEE